MVDWILPSIDETLPPVTPPITLLTVFGPLNAAVWPVDKPNLPEALKEVAADLLAEVRADRINAVGRHQCLRR